MFAFNTPCKRPSAGVRRGSIDVYVNIYALKIQQPFKNTVQIQESQLHTAPTRSRNSKLGKNCKLISNQFCFGFESAFY